MSVSSRVQHAVLPRPAGAPDSAGRDAAGESGRAVCGVHPRCAPARDHGAVVLFVEEGPDALLQERDRAWLHRPPRGTAPTNCRRAVRSSAAERWLRHAAQHRPGRTTSRARALGKSGRPRQRSWLGWIIGAPGHRPGRAAAQPARGNPGGQRHRRAVLSPAVSGVLRGPRAGGTAGAGAGPSGVAGSGDRAGRTRCSTRWVGVSACRSCRRRAGRRRRRWRRR